MGWMGKQKTKHPNLGLRKILAMWWQLEDNFEMMLENEYPCTLFDIFS